MPKAEATAQGRNGTDAAADAVTIIESTVQNVGRYRLSNGIVLEFTHVAPRAIRQAVQRVPEPEVPVVHIDEKDRDEPNPNDPAFLLAYSDYMEQQAMAAQAVGMMLGVRPVEIPEGVHPPESDAWIDELEAASVEVRREPEAARRYDWLILYAITSDADLTVCTGLATQTIGLTEDEVTSAIQSFRGGTGRVANRSARRANARSGQPDPVPEVRP